MDTVLLDGAHIVMFRVHAMQYTCLRSWRRGAEHKEKTRDMQQVRNYALYLQAVRRSTLP